MSDFFHYLTLLLPTIIGIVLIILAFKFYASITHYLKLKTKYYQLKLKELEKDHL